MCETSFHVDIEGIFLYIFLIPFNCHVPALPLRAFQERRSVYGHLSYQKRLLRVCCDLLYPVS